MKTFYDVIIVGGGPTGIFTAYELMEKDPTKSVLLIDKGLDIYNRTCPILQKKIKNIIEDFNLEFEGDIIPNDNKIVKRKTINRYRR